MANKPKRLEWHDVAEKMLLAGAGPRQIVDTLKSTNPEWEVKPNQVSKFKQRLKRHGASFPDDKIDNAEAEELVKANNISTKKLDEKTTNEIDVFIARCKAAITSSTSTDAIARDEALEELALTLSDDKEPK